MAIMGQLHVCTMYQAFGIIQSVHRFNSAEFKI